MLQLIHLEINALYSLQELVLARLENVQMLQQIALPIYHLVYRVEHHVKSNKLRVIYTLRLHKQHVMMYQILMEINVGWKVLVL